MLNSQGSGIVSIGWGGMWCGGAVFILYCVVLRIVAFCSMGLYTALFYK